MPELKTVEVVNALLDVGKVSEYLNIPRSTVYALSMKAQIPHFHIGKLLRFKKDTIDAWLENSGLGHER